MQTITREDATAAQLRHFAEMHGLDVPSNATKSQMVALLDQAGLDAETIEAPEVKRGRPAKADDGPHERVAAPSNAWMTILIPQQDGAQDAAAVGVNGKIMFIERGKPQRVQFKYFRQLLDARAYVYAPTEKGGLGEMRVVSTYPVQILEADPKITKFLAYLTEREARLAELLSAA